VEEANRCFGETLRSDLKLRTTLLACAICSEVKNACELMSIVLEKNVIPGSVKLDEGGIIDVAPLGNRHYCQMYACSACFCNGKVYLKHAQWNVHGFGNVHEMGAWLSEQSFVSTVVGTISVKHSGSGGHSFKQESTGPAMFYYHNVLETMHAFVRECLDEDNVAVGWVRQGQGASGKTLMMVRVVVVLKLFVKFWTQSATYRVQCLQHANGVWSAERMDKDLVPLIKERLEKPNGTKVTASGSQHSWPWKVTTGDVKRFYVKVGQVASMEGVSEIRLFIQAFPCLFPEMTHGKVVALAKEMSLKRFAHHLALLSDNRLCRHDRALFVLNSLLMKQSIFRQTFTGETELPTFLEGVGDLTKLDIELRKSIEQEVKEKEKDEEKEEGKMDRKDYQSDSLVYALISGMKMYAKNIPGHPMARSSYRRTLKCLHRSLNPGSVWLTININDKGNVWLKKMYGCSANDEPDYETVKSGGVVQALFFDAYVQSFLDNVLKGDGLFGELDWAGGTIEWCQDGTSHLHLIAAMKRVAPKQMAECFDNVDVKNRLEGWVGSLFCENNSHPEGGLLGVMEENGKLLHVHTLLCSKYQKTNAKGECKCRFEFGRPLCKPGNGKKAECVVSTETESWHWELMRDHSMALCHCDALYEIHHACGGLENFHHFCQFFGGSGADGQRVIMYATNYTTKMGMTRIEMKKMLREVVQQATQKMVKLGQGRWSQKDCVIWIISTALQRMSQGVCTTQAQAALNVLGLKEFHCSQDDKKIITLFSPPFVDYVKNKGKFKTAEMVTDYIFRGVELEKYSPWQLAAEQWKKVKRSGSPLKANLKMVKFLEKHPQHESHCLVRKAQKKRGEKAEPILVNVIRRQQFILDAGLRELWLLSLATSWRSLKDLAKRSWESECNVENVEQSVKTLNELLENELSLMKQKQGKKKGNGVADTVQGADAEKGRSKQNDNHTMVDDEKQDGTESPTLIIGGENGANTVIAARLAGLVPVEEVKGSSSIAGQVILSKEEYWNLKAQRQQGDGEDEEQELPTDVSLAEMGRIVEMWLVSSKVMLRCNAEHKVAIVECVLCLASSFCNQQVPDFSMVIQGSGGTGKTKSVIMGVKEFVDQVCAETDCEQWRKCLLVLAPTNLVALDIGGVTIDSGVLNRRAAQSGPRCSALVKLVLVDEYSMVSLGWIAQISAALQEAVQCKEKPFGGVSVVWIGDVHQLQPVMGLPVATPNEMLKNSKDAEGRLLWTGEKWKNRKALAVLMKQQYRMQEPLASIAERFANSEQTLDDAQLLSEQVLSEGAEDWETHFQEGSLLSRVLCTDNNSKAALNWEIAKWLHREEWYQWKAEDDASVEATNEVIDQLEPVQCAWKWMPVICLENYLGTDVVNGALCWVVNVVLEEPGQMPAAVLVVAAKSKEEATAKVEEDDLSDLLADKVVVPLMPVKRQGRKAIPYAPVWCMTVHKVQGATLDRAVLNVADQVSAPVLYTAITRVRSLDKLWFLQKLSPTLFLTMRYSANVNQEMRRLKKLEQATKQHLLEQMRKWRKVVPSLKDVAWLGDFGQNVDENENDETKVYEMEDSFEGESTVCTPIKMVSAVGEVNEENWIAAATMCSCPALLMLKAKQMQEVPEFLELDAKWSAEQANQIRRVQLVLKLAEEVKGAEMKVKWASVEKRERENEWNKVFKDKRSTCMRVMKEVMKEAGVKRHKQ
jgi:hypothetical protein